MASESVWALEWVLVLVLVLVLEWGSASALALASEPARSLGAASN